jgi:hypothetical protein
MSIPKGDYLDEKPVAPSVAVEQPLPEDDQRDLVNPDGSPITQEQVEPVQVAELSIGKLAGKGAKIITDALSPNETDNVLRPPKSPDTPTDAATPPDGTPTTLRETGEAAGGDQPLAQTAETGDVFVRPLSPTELNEIRTMMNDPEFDPNGEVVLPNLDYIDSGMTGTADEKFRKLVAATFKTYSEKNTGPDGSLRKGYRGFDEIIADANKIGSTDAMMMLMERKPGERPFTDAELLAARRTVLSFETMTFKLIAKYEKTGSDLDLAKALQAQSISAYAQIQLAGVQEDIGRTLVSNKIIAAPSKARTTAVKQLVETSEVKTAENMSIVINEGNAAQFIEQAGGRETAMSILAAYKNLPNDASRNRFAKMTLLERAKMTPRMAVELFQSALLTSGTTHAFNAAGQLVFMEMLMAERFLQGDVREAGAMLKAQAMYFPQAFKAMAHALVYEKSITEQTSKLDASGRQIARQTLGLRRGSEGGGMIESAAAYATDGFGIVMRMGGYRPMLAIDEFFKATGRGMQLEALSIRAATEAASAKRKELWAGVSGDEQLTDAWQANFRTEVDKAYHMAYMRTRNSHAAFEEASEFARMMTFQDDLPPAFQQYSSVMNNPITKIWIPFYKTPTQIFRRITERTPFGIFMPTVLKDKLIRGSAREKKEAVTRIMTGSAMMATLMYTSTGSVDEGFVITGYGPTDKNQRAEWMRNNQPYSIGIKKDDGTWDWVSYARYDPISGMLAMAADSADVLYNIEDDDMALDMMIAMGSASMRYTATALPMTQFIGEIVDLAGSPYASHESKLDRLQQLLTKQLVVTGKVMEEHITTGGLYGQQMKGTLERSGVFDENDRFGSSTIPGAQYDIIPGIGAQPVIRGYYEALNEVCAKTPGCSSTLPPRRNRWGEAIPQTRGTGWEFIQPWKILNKPNPDALNREMDKLGFGFSRLNTSMDEPLIKLTGAQYDRYITLYNNPSESPFAEDYFKVGSYKGIKVPEGVYETLNAELENQFYLTMPGATEAVPSNHAHRIKRLKAIDAEYKQYAKELMLLEFPELAALVQQRGAFKDATGQNPKRLLEPTAGETMEAVETNAEELFNRVRSDAR